MNISKFTVSPALTNKEITRSERFRIVSERFNELPAEKLNTATSRSDVAVLLGFQKDEPRGIQKVSKIIRDGYLRESAMTIGGRLNLSYYKIKNMPLKIHRKRKTNQEKNIEKLERIQRENNKSETLTKISKVVLEIKDIKLTLEQVDTKSLVSLIKTLG